MTETKTTDFIAERPRYGIRKAIAAIKDVVLIEEVAGEYGEFKQLGGGRLLGRCVSVNHEDRTPSLTVFTDTQRFKCFGCGLSGDVIDLEEIAGRHLEKVYQRRFYRMFRDAGAHPEDDAALW